MVAELRLTMSNIVDNDEYMQGSIPTSWVYNTKNNTIGMMQKMNIKLLTPTSASCQHNPKKNTPTQFDGKNPQFYEWAGDVKSYLSIHEVHIEDIIDESTRSLARVVLSEMSFPTAPAEDAVRGVLRHDSGHQEEDRRHLQFQSITELRVSTLHKAWI
eukprot:2631243-Amphidinium_carterae.1